MNVRLEEWEIKVLTQTFKECFEAQDRLWLFGSRVYPEKRGGDIDLYIEVSNYDGRKVYDQKSRFWISLQDRLGEQRIDIVIRNPDEDLLIYKIARQEGVLLV